MLRTIGVAQLVFDDPLMNQRIAQLMERGTPISLSHVVAYYMMQAEQDERLIHRLCKCGHEWEVHSDTNCMGNYHKPRGRTAQGRCNCDHYVEG